MAPATKAWAERVRAPGIMSWRAATPWSRRLLIAVSAAFALSVVVAIYLPRRIEREVWRSELDNDRATLAGLVSAVEVPRHQSELDHLDAFVRGALLQGDYVRVKLWAPDGTVIYSDDPTVIGERFAVEGGLATALAGDAFDEVSRFDRFENASERKLAERALEVYVPVEREGQVVAVWEVYRSLDRFDAAMDNIRRAVWASVGGALALLLVVTAALLGSLLRSLRRRGDTAAALSAQLATLLTVAKETARSINTADLARTAVDVMRTEAGFDGVALVTVASATHEVVATSGLVPSSCFTDAVIGSMRHGSDCTSLAVEVPAGGEHLVLAVCRAAADSPFTADDEIVVRAAAESIGTAWRNARLYEKLSGAEAAQRQLTRKLVASHEDERRTIVGDIHDGLGQDLHRVLYGLRRARSCSDGATEELDKLESIVEASIQDLRRLLRSLRPTALEDLGLLPALRSLVASENDDGAMVVDLRAEGVPEVDTQRRLAVYRIVQEALHNASRHGHAGHASVDLVVDDQTLVALIKDDGCGYEPAGGDGLGLWLMGERAEAVGGKVEIRREASGTAVEARIPIEASS